MAEGDGGEAEARYVEPLSVSKVVQFGKEERQEYDDEVKGKYSCIPDRGGKMERSGEGRESMQRMQKWRSGRCLPLDAALPAWDIVRRP